jgi:flagellar basal-body rod protein FlgB
MGPDDIPLFSMLKNRLGYLTERQKVVAQNVANGDTPGYQPRDLKPFTFQASLDAQATSGSGSGLAAPGRPLQMLTSSAGHIAPSKPASLWRSPQGPDSETTLDGNSVTLEDQMLKMTDARMNYDAAVSFYQRSMSMLRTAARRPNG